MRQLFRYVLRRWFLFARAVFDGGGSANHQLGPPDLGPPGLGLFRFWKTPDLGPPDLGPPGLGLFKLGIRFGPALYGSFQIMKKNPICPPPIWAPSDVVSVFRQAGPPRPDFFTEDRIGHSIPHDVRLLRIGQ